MYIQGQGEPEDNTMAIRKRQNKHPQNFTHKAKDREFIYKRCYIWWHPLLNVVNTHVL